MIIALLFIKNSLKGSWTLFLAYWRVLIPILILAYGAYSFNALYKAKNEAVLALATFKQAIALERQLQVAEIAIKSKIAQKEVAQAEQLHTTQLGLIKDAYDKRHKTNINTIFALRDELRTKVASDSFKMPDPYTDTIRTTDEWQNSYRTLVTKYETLVDACSVTTSDYNLLREWADASCNQVGCE